MKTPSFQRLPAPSSAFQRLPVPSSRTGQGPNRSLAHIRSAGMIKFVNKVLDSLSSPPQIAGLFIASYLIGSTSVAKGFNVKVRETYEGLEFVKRREERYRNSIHETADANIAKKKAMLEKLEAMRKKVPGD